MSSRLHTVFEFGVDVLRLLVYHTETSAKTPGDNVHDALVWGLLVNVVDRKSLLTHQVGCARQQGGSSRKAAAAQTVGCTSMVACVASLTACLTPAQEFERLQVERRSSQSGGERKVLGCC